MRLRDFKHIGCLLFLTQMALGQSTFSVRVLDAQRQTPLNECEILSSEGQLLAKTNANGLCKINPSGDEFKILVFSYDYQMQELTFTAPFEDVYEIQLAQLNTVLSEVEIKAHRLRVFEMRKMQDIEETAIYAGKKSEVVLLEHSLANLATNNARQIYSQVVGLNIYQNDDAGIQLNIGGRGLDPNRTSNFNTRQNGYDISADVLGYPESYYSPPSEALKEIQVIRGAASLQYGTQFGGLVNFKFKDPIENRKIKVVSRNTIGSNGLYTNFTSLSGTVGKLSYYGFGNFKKGDGFRPNSEFESVNGFFKLKYDFSERTYLSGEVTKFKYLAKQGGGLTDQMFEENPFQSNRSRNWFGVDWLVMNVKFAHKLDSVSTFTSSLFALKATRNALGFRTNRVSQLDSGEERDLIVGDFKNIGIENRFLKSFHFFNKKNYFLIGNKVYIAQNSSQQGPGSDGSDADFNFYSEAFPDYSNQSYFEYPNVNLSLFGENIIYLNKKWNLTPGFRMEYINTKSDGYFQKINTDGAGNVIFEEKIEDQRTNKRAFLLMGIGSSYKFQEHLEFYANVSQNYRSVTFSDISIVNPAFSINPDISDEKGFTTDMGFRGQWKRKVNFDVGFFALRYNDRIGFIPQVLSDGRIVSERGNVGDAMIFGVESLVDINLRKFSNLNDQWIWEVFLNASFIDSKYTRSDQNGIEGNRVEFIPGMNLKSGVKFGYRNFILSLQNTYLSRQYTDATNAIESNLSGIIGQIPSYNVMDLGASYSWNWLKFEFGINNILDQSYFTRRATGYPGPGIIPSPPRNMYLTVQFELY